MGEWICLELNENGLPTVIAESKEELNQLKVWADQIQATNETKNRWGRLPVRRNAYKWLGIQRQVKLVQVRCWAAFSVETSSF